MVVLPGRMGSKMSSCFTWYRGDVCPVLEFKMRLTDQEWLGDGPK